MGERVFAAESIIKRRIRKVSPRPGLSCAPRGRVGARGPSGRSGPASRAPSATPAPPPPRVPASSPPPPPIFFPFCFSGTYRVPGEMEGVGNQVSIVGSVAWGPGRRQEGTRALGGGACWRPRGVPLPLGFSFCFSARVTRQVQHLGTRGEHSGFEAHRSLRAEVSWGSCPARWGAVQGSGKSGLGRGVGPGKGLIFFWRFLTAGKGNVSCMGPRREDPNPKLSS